MKTYIRITRSKNDKSFECKEYGYTGLMRLARELTEEQLSVIVKSISNDGFCFLGNKYCKGNVYFSSDDEYELYLSKVRYDDSDAEDSSVQKTLSILHESNSVFRKCDTESSLLKSTIEIIKDVFKLDRASIFVISPDKNSYTGSWGLDLSGDIISESSVSAKIPNSPWAKEVMQYEGFIRVWEGVPLVTLEKAIEREWNAVLNIWSGDEAVGWLSCFNLKGSAGLTEHTKESLQVLMYSVGYWLSKITYESQLSALNTKLEAKVEIQSDTLSRREIELNQARLELVDTEKSKAIAQFTSGLAHEFNNPISFVMSNLNFIKKIISSFHIEDSEFSNQDKIDECLEVIEESNDGLDRVAKVIQMLQPLNKLSNEPYQTFSLNEVVDFLKNALPSESTHVSWIQPKEHTYLHTAMQAFSIAMENILQNAVEAVSNLEKGRITIFVFRDESTLTVSVSDNGKGISQDNLSSVTTPFFTTKGVGDGMGLGLSLADNLVKIADGRLKVSSQLNVGTQVDITFPIGVFRNGEHRSN